MRTPPTDLDSRALAEFVGERWGLVRPELSYAPVGFGSHHWVADTGSGRRFVTVDDLRGPRCAQRLNGLRCAMRAASVIGRRVAQVVAPQPSTDGGVVQHLDPGFAVTVFELHDAPALGDWDPGRRTAAIELLARVHGRTDAVAHVAREEDFALPGRVAVDDALGGLAGPTDLWMTGPYALPTRQVLTRDVDLLLEALADHDRTADRMRADRAHWVITHGEPHARNLLTRGDRLLLIDWDTALLAPAARDLWHVDAGDGVQVRQYTAITGRRVPREDLDFYRLRWDLMEVCSYVEWFTTAHTATADAEIGWGGLVEAFENLERRDRSR